MTEAVLEYEGEME